MLKMIENPQVGDEVWYYAYDFGPGFEEFCPPKPIKSKIESVRFIVWKDIKYYYVSCYIGEHLLEYSTDELYTKEGAQSEYIADMTEYITYLRKQASIAEEQLNDSGIR